MRKLALGLWIVLFGWHMQAALRETTLASILPKIFRTQGGFNHK